MNTTNIHVSAEDYWAHCDCGFSMRIPSPNDPNDKVQIPTYCGGCGRRIVWDGHHRHFPHVFKSKGRATVNWGGRCIGDIIPGCALCGKDEGAEQHKQAVSA